MFRKAQTALWTARAGFRGWRNRAKILVLESDDWGCKRMPSRQAYEALADRGYALDRSALCLDMRERPEDVVSLFEVLGAHEDRRGRPACMTGNMIVANPDFENIRGAHFNTYGSFQKFCN
jgi:hypothetical protein